MNRLGLVFAPAMAGAVMFGIPRGLLLGLLTGMGLTKLFEKKDGQEVFGGARYATKREIAKAKLFSNRGIIVGEYDKRFLRYDGDRHILIVGATRAGKGVGIIIPTLLALHESVFVLDTKRENWEKTAGKRSEYGPVYKFEPDSHNSARYNPIDDLRRDEHELGDIQALSLIICHDPTAKEQHWARTAASMVTAAMLYLRYRPEGASLGTVYKFLNQAGESITGTFEKILEDDHPKQELLQSPVSEILKKTEKELSYIHSTLMGHINIFNDPIVAKNTASSDFSLRDLHSSARPVSIYLVCNPRDITDRLNILMRLVVDQVGRVVTEDGVKKRKQRILLVLDEFAALGHMRFFDNALSYLAGYGVRALIACQSIQQLTQLYGSAQTIADNCYMRILMTPNSLETAQYISRSLGKRTVRYTGSSSPLKAPDQKVGRDLLTEEEALRFPENEQLIFLAGSRTVRCRKIISYNHEFFRPHFKEAPKIEEITIPVEELLLDGDIPGTTLKVKKWPEED